MSRFELEGGAVGFVEPSPGVPLVNVTLSLRSGAAQDPVGSEGATRLTARMLRRGCDGMTANQIEEAVDRLGAELGAEVSSSTLTVHGQVIRRNLRPFVELFAKLVASPTFDAAELQRLARETAAAIVDGRDDDRGLCERAYRRAMFAAHPYGRSVRGTRQSVACAAQGATVRAMFGAHFTRGNAVLAFAGDLTEDEAKTFGERLVAALRPGAAVADVIAEPTRRAGRHLVLVDKPDRTQTQILIGTLASHPHDADHVPLVVASAVFGGSFTARLMREVRSKRGWSYGASSRLGVDRHRQPMTLWTFPAQADAAACIGLEIGLLDALVKDGITPAELRFAQRYMSRSWAFEIDTPAKRAHQALGVEVLGLPADYYAGHVARVKTTTVEACNAALAAHVHTSCLLVCVVGTAKTMETALAGAIPDLASRTVVAFDDD